MQLQDVVLASAAVAGTRSRLRKSSTIAELLRAANPAEVGLVVAYLIGELPQGRIGLGYAAVREVEAGMPPSTSSLSLREVDARFSDMATARGTGSATRKRALLGELLALSTDVERSFLKRLLLGELRQGALEGVMVDALATAFGIDGSHIRRATMLAGRVPPVAVALATEGRGGLDRFSLRLFTPVLPMLAHPADDAETALERLGCASFEVKVDGARVQAHKDGSEVRLFSRRLNDVTHRIPEVADAVRSLPIRRAILDGEAIALKPDGRPLPFQVTMRRFGRKLKVDAMRDELPMTGLFFDALLVDNETLLEAATRHRIEALTAVVPESNLIERCVTEDAEEADAFFVRAVGQGHEGLMAKGLDAPYEAGTRGKSWLKLKPAHTLDLVVLAAEWGSGRRKGWLSNLHLGALDPTTGGFIMLGKTFKGMTDELLRWQTKELQARALGSTDDWVVPVRPELVVEIAFNDVQASPHYPGGLALRFARVKRYRTDKKAMEVDTIDTVRALASGDARRG